MDPILYAKSLWMGVCYGGGDTMSYQLANYTAFYVAEPFSESNLGAFATPDFVYYNQLRAWKAKDSSFPFVDAHEKTYNVRDDSSWETLKSRLHKRLNISANIILLLSKNTRNSRALREEIEYGINTLGLPVIVVYPDYSEKKDICDNSSLRMSIKKLWDNLPTFRDSLNKVTSLHVPYDKDLIAQALKDPDLRKNTMAKEGIYFYTVK